MATKGVICPNNLLTTFFSRPLQVLPVFLPVVPDCAASTAVWYVHGVVLLCRDTCSISLFPQYFAAFKTFLGGNLGSECAASSQNKR